MILALLAVAVVGIVGSVGFPVPVSRWLLAIAVLAGVALAVIFIEQVLVGIESWWALRKRAADARRRNSYGYRVGRAFADGIAAGIAEAEARRRGRR